MTKTPKTEKTGGRLLGLRALIVLGVSVFIFFAFATAPASFLGPILKAGVPQLQYTSLSGSVWKNRMTDISYNGVFYGDLDLRLKPASLIFGSVAARIELSGGALRAFGDIKLNPISGRMQIKNAAAAYDLSNIKRYTMYGIPYSGEVRVDLKKLTLHRTQGCLLGDGGVWTSALDEPATDWIGEGVVFSGPLSCEDGSARLDLAGENSHGQAAVEISLTPELTYALSVMVLPSKNSAPAPLTAIGFENKDGAFVYDAIGAIKGAGV